MLLQDKTAILYGAGGSLGGAVARAFAAAGARVFLTGRTKDELDVLDEYAVDAYAAAVASQAGSIDISFNLVTPDDVHGIPLADMTTADFLRPIMTGLTAAFVTARAAARVMVRQGSGVILTLSSGGSGPAGDALDSFVRNLASEVAPAGVRVAAICPADPEQVAAAATFLASDQSGESPGCGTVR